MRAWYWWSPRCHHHCQSCIHQTTLTQTVGNIVGRVHTRDGRGERSFNYLLRMDRSIPKQTFVYFTVPFARMQSIMRCKHFQVYFTSSLLGINMDICLSISVETVIGDNTISSLSRYDNAGMWNACGCTWRWRVDAHEGGSWMHMKVACGPTDTASPNLFAEWWRTTFARTWEQVQIVCFASNMRTHVLTDGATQNACMNANACTDWCCEAEQPISPTPEGSCTLTLTLMSPSTFLPDRLIGNWRRTCQPKMFILCYDSAHLSSLKSPKLFTVTFPLSLLSTSV